MDVAENIEPIKKFVDQILSDNGVPMDLKEINALFDFISIFSDIVDNHVTAYEISRNYQLVADIVTEKIVPVLEEMKSATTDEVFQDVLETYITLICTTDEEDLKRYIEEAKEKLKNKAENDSAIQLALVVLGKCIEQIPTVGPLITEGYKFVDIVANVEEKGLYDQIIWNSNRFNLAFIAGMDNVFTKLTINSNNESLAEKYSSAYIYGLEMLYRLLNYECSLAIDYYKVWKVERGEIENFENHLDSLEANISNKINRLHDYSLYNECMDIIANGLTITYNLDGGTGNIPNDKKYIMNRIIQQQAFHKKMGMDFGVGSMMVLYILLIKK